MAKLMVVADIDKHCSASSRGLELARHLGLELEVVAFVWTSLKSLELDDIGRAELRQRLLDEREKDLEEHIAKYRRSNQKVTLKIVWEKNIAPWLVRRLNKGKYIGVIKTGCRSETIVHTSVDWHLLRESPVPVLIVARDRWLRTKPVLAALDLGTRHRSKCRLNHQIVESVCHIAQVLDTEPKFIAAIEVPSLLSDIGVISPANYVREQKEAMKTQWLKLVEAHRLSPQMLHIRRGPVARVICNAAAKERAQLVVMGSVGRQSVRDRMLGRTAESVLQLLHTDILVLKPES